MLLRDRFSASSRSKLLTWPLACLVIILCVSALGPHLLPHAPWEQNLTHRLESPSWHHWLGTDRLGRDNLSRLVHATQVSLCTAALATAISVVVGTCYGIAAGYSHGWLKVLLLRIIDILYALPHLLIVILLMMVTGQSMVSLCFSIGLLSWLNMARIVYAQVVYLRGKAYLDAACALGQSPIGLVLKHLLPNLAPLIIVCTTLTVPAVILMESTLSFLGLGVRPPSSSLGDMIRQGVSLMEIYPTTLLAPCMVLTLLLVALTFLGEALEQAHGLGKRERDP